MLGSWRHLTARLVDVVSAKPLEPAERERVMRLLQPSEIAMFFGQDVADQRHGLDSATHVEDRTQDRPDLIRAALLHDVGKRHAGLGPFSRILASLVIRSGLPRTSRIAAYENHGPLGAADLERIGAEPAVVAFAARHHSERPDEFGSDEWRLLCEADRARIRRRDRNPRYSGSDKPIAGMEEPGSGRTP